MPSILVARPVPRSHVPAIARHARRRRSRSRSSSSPAGGSAPGCSRPALWVAGQALALVLQRLPLGMGSLASSGAVAFGRMFRAVGVMAVLIVVTVSDSSLGIPAVAVYAFAYSAEFGVVAVVVFRRGGRNMRVKGLVAMLVGLALIAPASASAGDVRPLDRVQPQGLGADPSRRRSTSRSTAPSSTCSSARPSPACSGSASCAGGSRPCPAPGRPSAR